MSSRKQRKSYLSPYGGGDRALALQSKGQQFDPRLRQLEKVVNLDENENSQTHTQYKTLFRWLSGHRATMSAAVRLHYTQYGPTTNGGITEFPDATFRYRTILRVVHGCHNLCERYTFAKQKTELSINRVLNGIASELNNWDLPKVKVPQNAKFSHSFF